MASIRLTTPNKLIKMQVDGCRMKNLGGENGIISYDFITNNCPDVFTSAKLIQDPNGAEGP